LKEYGIDSNTIYSFASKGVAMVFFFATDIFLARILPISVYGEWSYFYALIVVCFWFCWMGINASSRVYIAEEAEKNELLLTCIRTTFIIRIISGAGVAIALFVIAPLIYPFFKSQTYPDLGILFSLAAFIVFFNSINEYIKSIWIGLRKQKYLFWQTLTEFLCLFLIVFGLVSLYRASFFIGISYIASFFLSSIVGIVILIYYVKKNHISDTMKPAPGYWKKIVKYAIPLWIMSIGAVIQLEIGAIMVGALNTPEEVAVYSVAKKISDKAIHINLAYIFSIIPAFAVITSENVQDKLSLLKKSIIINTGIAIITALVLLGTGMFLVTILYGEQYTKSTEVLFMFIPYYFLFALASIFFHFLEYQKIVFARNLAFFGMVVINIALNYILIPNFGALGAAIASSISVFPFLLTVIVISVRLLRSYAIKC